MGSSELALLFLILFITANMSKESKQAPSKPTKELQFKNNLWLNIERKNNGIRLHSVAESPDKKYLPINCKDIASINKYAQSVCAYPKEIK